MYIPPIKLENGWARSDYEKAAAFADHLSNTFVAPERRITEQEETALLQELDSPPQSTEDQIKSVTVREVQEEIKKLKIKKSPGYDGLNGKTLKELPQKAVRFLTIIINSCLRLKHFPRQWKVAQIILIPKPGKSPELLTSYRPISLLPLCSKICERLILARLRPIIEKSKLIPEYQFGFRESHSTLEQVNRIVVKIRESFENKKYCSAVFLDVAQAFDKVWHAGLLYKIKLHFPDSYYQLLKSYLENRTFQTKVGGETSELHKIHAGVPQGSVIGPTLYLLYTADLPTSDNITTATYADDTALLSAHPCPDTTSLRLQEHLRRLEEWYKAWRIKVNETKSVHTTFTLRKGICPSVELNGVAIPQSPTVKYLGIHLDQRLTWRSHIWTKRKQLGTKIRSMYWLLGRRSALNLDNKLLLYKSIIKQVWTYGIQLWGAASKTNIEIIERLQSKVLRGLVDAPWYVTNDAIRKDLEIQTVQEEIQRFNNNYKKRLKNHPNLLAAKLDNVTFDNSRLKKYKLL
uniref:Reverse transcriptase domain-containing protein n=1 Tax=Trichogramma kaykai TaxID=54128 RepID=A0ABD2W1S9_9HYME